MSREPAQTWLFPTANKQLYKQAQDGYYLVLQRSNASNERALYCKQKQSLGWCVITGSLSNSVVERRTSTGSGPFALLGSGLFETLG